MDKKKILAIITGAISVAIAIAYLVLVQLLDFRGEMIPAPVDLSVTSQQSIAFERVAGELNGISAYVHIYQGNPYLYQMQPESIG